MKSLRLFTALFLMFILFSCKSGPTSDAPETGFILPLGVGNMWVTENMSYGSDGSAKQEATDTTRIINHSRLNQGITYYDYNDVAYYANFTDGLYITDKLVIYPQLIYKYPAKVGESFRWAYIKKRIPFPTPIKPDSAVDVVIQYTVTAKSISITVPAGTFNCYAYQTDFVDVNFKIPYTRTIEYFAPNYGAILQEDYIRDATNELKLAHKKRLLSYKVD